jgi:hypothetical protein
MKSRIKEIAVEAGLISAEYNGFDRTNLTESENKFAELIVNDVLNIVAVGGEFCSRPKLFEQIKEHFGVENI